MLRPTGIAQALAISASLTVGLAPLVGADSGTGSPAVNPTPSFSTLLPYGSSHGQVGHAYGGEDTAERGVNAVSVASDGTLRLLDGVNQRIVQLTPQGSPREDWTLTGVSPDCEVLTSGEGDVLAAFSPLRSSVRLIATTGNDLGNVLVPRSIRDIVAARAVSSRQVVIQSALQERFVLGSPSQPQVLDTILHTQREGAWSLPNGQGIVTRVDANHKATLAVVDDQGERAVTTGEFALGSKALSARIVGVQDDVVCTVLERGPDQPAVDISREAKCVNASTGDVLLDVALPKPARFVPRISVTFGGRPSRLVLIQPESAGLRVIAWPVRNEGVRP